MAREDVSGDRGEMPKRTGVVVGVDGSPASLAAVQWAAARANAQGTGLRIVHALDSFEGATASCLDVGQRVAAAQKLVDQGLERALAVSPELDVRCDVVDGPPVNALNPPEAQLICIGSSGAAPAHPGHRASIATELLLEATCGVVVVRSTPAPAGWVVAEISADPTASDLLRTAVHEAALRRAPLRLVCADEEVHARLVEDVARWRSRHDDLDVVVASTAWRLDEFLSRYANQIALFVAPRRHLHEIGTVLDTSAATALAMLQCPVLITGTPARRTDPSPSTTSAAVNASRRVGG